jgi:hypothetical protein
VKQYCNIITHVLVLHMMQTLRRAAWSADETEAYHCNVAGNHKLLYVWDRQFRNKRDLI